MSKLNNLNPEVELSVFADALGSLFPKIVADTKAMLGDIKAEEITGKQGGWKCSAKGVLTSKEGYTVHLPLNNPKTTLLRFGMNLTALATAGTFDIRAEIPKECEFWIQEESKKLHASKTVTVKA
jgi:hypothetical protein